MGRGLWEDEYVGSLMSALPPSTVIAKVEDIDEVLLPQELVSDYAGGVIPLLSREGHGGAGVKPYHSSRGLFMRLGLVLITYLLMRLGGVLRTLGRGFTP